MVCLAEVKLNNLEAGRSRGKYLYVQNNIHDDSGVSSILLLLQFCEHNSCLRANLCLVLRFIQ